MMCLIFLHVHERSASNHSWPPSFQLATICTFGRLQANLNFRYVECHGMPPTTRTVITSVRRYKLRWCFWLRPNPSNKPRQRNCLRSSKRYVSSFATAIQNPRERKGRSTRFPWCVKDARARWKFISVCRVRG